MDHLTPEQKAVSPFFEHLWETRGWGLGLGIITRHHDLGREAGGRWSWSGVWSLESVDP
jgi:hypothetical protein